MIKTTIAVMASLMLVSCGNGDEPEGGTPAGPNATNVDSNKVDATDAPSQPDASKATPAAAKDLTLTYFNIDG